MPNAAISDTGSLSFRRAFACAGAIACVLCGCGGSAAPPSPAPPPATKVSQPPAVKAELPPAAPSTPNGQPATVGNVSLAKLDQVKELVAAAKGKVLVVNVWATFCIPCAEEMPEFVKFYNGRDPEKVAFLSLNADPAYNLDDAVKPFMAEQHMPFSAYLLDEVSPTDLAALLGAADSGWTGDLPATFVVNPAGKAVKTWFAPVNAAQLAEAVSAAQG